MPLGPEITSAPAYTDIREAAEMDYTARLQQITARLSAPVIDSAPTPKASIPIGRIEAIAEPDRSATGEEIMNPALGITHSSTTSQEAVSQDTSGTIDTLPCKVGNPDRGGSRNGRIISTFAGLAVAGVIGYVGYETVSGIRDMVHGVEHFFSGFGHAFEGQVDVKMKAKAALGHVTIPDDTIGVVGTGFGEATTDLSFKCPSMVKLMCDEVPKAHDGIIPYMRNDTKVQADDDIIFGEKTFDLSVGVDASGNPYTIAVVNTSQVRAQTANEVSLPQTHRYLTQNFADMLGLKTADDPLTTYNENLAKATYLNACSPVLQDAVPAAVARTVRFWEQKVAAGLISNHDAATAQWLEKLAEQPVHEVFSGPSMNLTGEASTAAAKAASVDPSRAKQTGVLISQAVTKQCDVSEQTQKDLKGFTGQEGKAYVVDPNSSDKSSSKAKPTPSNAPVPA